MAALWKRQPAGGGIRRTQGYTGQRETVECDTLVTAIGLIPDRTLCRSLTEHGRLPDWLRLCGNCAYVHGMVDSVIQEASALGAGNEV